jgi:hypothetical protein
LQKSEGSAYEADAKLHVPYVIIAPKCTKEKHLWNKICTYNSWVYEGDGELHLAYVVIAPKCKCKRKYMW